MADELQPAFPFSMSINEPHTVSLPLPADVVTPKPVLTGIEPSSCAIGDADFQLVVSGEDFTPYSVIHFAGHDEPSTYDAEAGTLSTGVKPSLWAEPVVVPVSVRTGSVESDPMEFEFLAVGATSEVYDENLDRDEEERANTVERHHNKSHKRKR